MGLGIRGWIAAGVVSVVGWSAPAWAQSHGTIFVDDDRQQCRNAEFTSIQAAVQAAPPGARIHVCPGVYPESVTVDRPLTIDGAGPSVKVRTGDPTREAVVQVPPFTRGFIIDTIGAEVSGFTIFGDGNATLGVDVRPTGTGNTVRDNFISGHAGAVRMAIGGPARQQQLIRGNRLEDSRFGIAIDNNLGPDLEPFPIMVTVVQNDIARVQIGISLKRLFQMEVSHNTITDFSDGIDASDCHQVVISHNDLETGTSSNVGISLSIDAILNAPDFAGTAVIDNDIRGRSSGPSLGGIVLDHCAGYLVTGNRISRMEGDGVLLTTSDNNSVFLNRSDENGDDGIVVRSGSGNQLFLNSMHDNAVFDGEDDNRPANTWVHNRCETDNPPGTICEKP